MKKHLQILFTLLSLFLLNGNGFLHANTYQHSDFSLGEKEWINSNFESTKGNNLDKHSVERENSFSNQTNFDALISLFRSYPVKNKNKEIQLSNFVKKEEKIKPILFKYITVQTVVTSLFEPRLFNDFYFVKNLNLVSYFKSFVSHTYKRYLRLQVFRI